MKSSNDNIVYKPVMSVQWTFQENGTIIVSNDNNPYSYKLSGNSLKITENKGFSTMTILDFKNSEMTTVTRSGYSFVPNQYFTWVKIE